MRDLSGFVETRQQLLTLKPNHRMNWIGFAVSQHLNAKYVLFLEALNLNMLLYFYSFEWNASFSSLDYSLANL